LNHAEAKIFQCYTIITREEEEEKKPIKQYGYGVLRGKGELDVDDVDHVDTIPLGCFAILLEAIEGETRQVRSHWVKEGA